MSAGSAAHNATACNNRMAATMINRLGDSLDFHSQALTLRSERQRLLASNIANADTPGYVARDMDFASALRDATGTALAGTPALSALRTGLAALPGGFAAETHLRYASPSQSNLDGNSVDMDRERASFADNSVKYEATLRFINSQVRTMLDAMKSHQQG
jgi:flagellar basal-body rod protein FlgB